VSAAITVKIYQIYSLTNNITCAPDVQMVSTIECLEANGIQVLRSKESRYSTDIGPVVNRIWLDVEDENPSKYYDPNPEYNAKFLQSMEAVAVSMAVQLGIYTTKVIKNKENNSQFYTEC